MLLTGCITSQSIANQKSTLIEFKPDAAYGKYETVVLLHGLNRTSRSMRPLAQALSNAGYTVCSIKYPSRYFSVAELADKFVWPKIEKCVDDETKSVNFVTHSLGGILVRYLDKSIRQYPQGKLVMLSPPNQGSVAVDRLQNSWFFQQMAGPVGNDLGTEAESLPNTLPVPSMPFGVIAAVHSNSAMSFIIPGDDDGKVSLLNMQLDGMSDFITVNSTHSFMMGNSDTIKYVLNFLHFGKFQLTK